MKKCKIYRIYKNDEPTMTIRATRLRIDKLENLIIFKSSATKARIIHNNY